MTRTELLEKICYSDYTNDCCSCDGHYNCQDCEDMLNPLFDEYDKQIRKDAIEELGKVLCDELDKGYIFINKHQILHFVKQLKEQK